MCSRLQIKVTAVDKKYWLARERTSLRMATVASSSRARLAHYDLAGRYSVKAAGTAGASSRIERRLSASQAIASTGEGQPLSAATSDAFYYSCLEQGAKYLADRAADPDERAEHLRAGAAYAARAEEAAPSGHAHRVH